MKLHQNKTLFRQAVQFTSDQRQILPIYIEKDYWVTYALYTLFRHEIGNDTVFKGGTALSKCYKTIDRFSEDIDLVVLRHESDTNSRMTTKIKTIGDVVSGVMPEVEIAGVTQKMGMNRKTAHNYEKEFKGDFGQVRNVILVEATWLGYFEPYTTKQVVSLIGEMMIGSNQTEIATANDLLPFDVRVLEPTRTLCEKIMSLVRFSYGEDAMDNLKKKIRHVYDLHQLLKKKEFNDFFESEAFSAMLLKVANDDVASYKNNNAWLAHHPKEALLFKDVEEVWNDLKATYNGDFRKLVYDNFPSDESVLDILKKIRERVAKIEWNIDVEKK